MKATELQKFLNHFRSYPQNQLLMDDKVISDFLQSNAEEAKSQANTLTDELKEAFKAGQSAETSADADQFDDSEFNEWAKSRLSEPREEKQTL